MLEGAVLLGLAQVVVCILPAAEKTRSTPAEEAGAARYCLTIFASIGHLLSLAFHHASTSTSMSGSSGSARLLLELVEIQLLGLLRLLLHLASKEAAKAHLALLGHRFRCGRGRGR